MTEERNVRFKIGRDTASNWTANDAVLLDGEPGYEDDTGKIKYGNGEQAYHELPYAWPGNSDPIVALSTLTPLADSLPYFISGSVAGITPLTSFARMLLGDASASSAQDTLALVPGTQVFKQRTITGTAGEIVISNGDGIADNPTVALSSSIVGDGKTWAGGTFSNITLAGTTVLPGGGQIGSTGSMGAIGSITVDGTKVIGPQITGWGTPTGTSTRTSFATYTAPTISNPPTQAEVQAVADAVQSLSQHLKALIDDLKTHGLIAT